MKNYVIYILSSLFVLVLFSACSEDSNITLPSEHHELYGVNIYNADTLYLRVFNAQIDTNYHTGFELLINQEQHFDIKYLDEEGNEVILNDENVRPDVVLSDTSIVKVNFSNTSKWSFELKGLKNGSSSIEIRLLHVDHADFKTPQIPAFVK